MKPKLLERVVCPHCRMRLLVSDIAVERDREILEGALRCTACQRTYRISNRVPDFRPPKLLNDDSSSVADKDIEVKQANILLFDRMAKYYESDASNLELFEPYTQSRIDEILDNIASTRNAELLLDLGCGTGNILLAGRKYFKECLGVDLSPEMLSIAQSRNFDVVCADVASTPFLDSIADAVTCYSVLHHLYEPKPLFEEAYRLLKDGGVFYSDWDPNKSSAILEDSWLYSLVFRVFKKLPRHREDNVERLGLSKLQEMAEYYHKVETGLDPTSLKAQLEEIGFRDVTIISHSDCSSLRKNTFWRISLTKKAGIVVKFLASGRPSYSYLATYFLILARK